MSWKSDVDEHLYVRNLIFNCAVSYQLNLGYHSSGSMFHADTLHNIISLSMILWPQPFKVQWVNYC